MSRRILVTSLCWIALLATGESNASAAEKINADPGRQLPDPDGKPADLSKPVQVYILLGQSNMLGFGRVAGDKDGTLEHAVKTKKLYPYLVDDAGKWTERQDVRNVRIMGSGTGGMRGFNNEWMTIKGGRIGPEIGIGHHVGQATEAPVLILKSCIGNRALGWDLLPRAAKALNSPIPRVSPGFIPVTRGRRNAG